jgi:hypothetical protein
MTKRKRPTMPDPEKLRELASWYRELAERAGNPTIWDLRLRTAEDLEAEARSIERLVQGDT